MANYRDRLTARQRDALWKWHWLGWRNSTPAFKLSLTVLAIVGMVGFGVAVFAVR